MFKEPKESSKTAMILKYLEENGTITSLEAIEKFGATRLSAIIFNLRNRYGYIISTNDKNVRDRFGNKIIVAEYKLDGRTNNG